MTTEDIKQSWWQSEDGVTLPFPDQMHGEANVNQTHTSVHIQQKNKDIYYLLDLLVDNDAHSMLGNIVDTSCLAMVALMRHTFLNGACALKLIIYEDTSMHIIRSHLYGCKVMVKSSLN